MKVLNTGFDALHPSHAHKGLFHITLLFSVSLLFLLTGQVYPQNLTIGNYNLVMGERVGLTEFEYTYQAEVTNTGAAVRNVTATVTSTSQDTVVVEGALTFGDVPAGSTVESQDAFIIRHDRRIRLNPGALVWEIQAEPILASIVGTSPANGEGDVAVTRETIIRLSKPLADATVVDENTLFAEFGGQRLSVGIHISPNRRGITMFYRDNLPASARVRVTLIGDGLLDVEGDPVDADNDGLPGGVAIIDFDTLNLTVLPDTSVCGRVFASELGDNGMNVGLEGVTITVDGMEDTLRAVTDPFGNFRLEPVPAGQFFVHIDGRTATNDIPDGAYYPFVGKAWESIPGGEVNVGNIYLPLVVPETLQTVSMEEDTEITFPDEVLAEHPELEGMQLIVPADSLYSDDGIRGGMVGITPVAPDRLPGELPEGLEFPIVITVQTDGATNFDTPVPVCFPNLPDPGTSEVLPPGAKAALWSFNHDTGRFEVVGSMTVSDDGERVCTDPGVGILAPGWHGTDPACTGGDGPPGDDKKMKECCEKPCDCDPPATPTGSAAASGSGPPPPKRSGRPYLPFFDSPQFSGE